MSTAQTFIIIGMCILGTQITRWLPFLIFKDNKPTPKYVLYLGKALPLSVFGMLTVYCLKGVEIINAPHGIPELIGVLATAGAHILKKNFFISITVGSVMYIGTLYLMKLFV